MSNIRHLQEYMFRFVVEMSQLFQVDISTKRHRLMRHVEHDLIHMGCLQRRSSEKNEMVHKAFKVLYNSTNKFVDSIASQILTTCVEVQDQISNSYDISLGTPFQTITSTRFPSAHTEWTSLCVSAIAMVEKMSGFHCLAHIANQSLSLSENGLQTWNRLKRVVFDLSVPSYDCLLYISPFVCGVVYVKHNRHDSIYTIPVLILP